MGKFNVKVQGPFMDLYRYFREQGFGIKEAKAYAREEPATFNFETFEEFVECVKYFHREPFVVEADCDFETDMTGYDAANVLSGEDIEEIEDFSNEIHLDNIETINAIIHWQQSKDTISMICENDAEPLMAGIDQEDNTVVLGCKECDYVRRDIPDNVIEYYNNRQIKEEENGKREN